MRKSLDSDFSRNFVEIHTLATLLYPLLIIRMIPKFSNSAEAILSSRQFLMAKHTFHYNSVL